MTSKAIKFLEAHESETPSRFVEESTWRKENASWLRWWRQLEKRKPEFQEHRKY